MTDLLQISVVVPTYNRLDTLRHVDSRRWWRKICVPTRSR